MNPYGLTDEELAKFQAERDARVAQHWGPPPAPPPPPSNAPALAQGTYPGAIRYDETAKIPGAVQYDEGAKIPGAIQYEPPPAFQPDPNAIDLDDPNVVGHADAVDLDAMRSPVSMQREMVSGRRVQHRAPSGPANPDPWGIKSAQKGLLDTYDAREASMRTMQSAEADKAAVIGDHRADLARRQSEDASFAMMEQQYASEHFDQKMTELERQLADVSTKKIDPQRLMKETPGLGFLAIIGGAVGGFYQGLTRSGENPFLKELNIMIDRDIAAQEKEIDTGLKGASQQMGLLAQQRAIFQDSQQAKMAARALYYQSAEEQLMAEAARYDAPIYKERAEMAAQEIRAEKQALLLKMAEQQRAQSAAAASSMYARDKEVRAMRNDIYDKVLAATGNPAMAETEADRQVAISYGLRNQVPERGATSMAGASPVSALPKDLRSEGAKEYADYAKAEKAVQAMDELFARYGQTDLTDPTKRDALRATMAGVYKTALGPGMSSNDDFERFIWPNVPKTGTLDSTRDSMKQNIATVIRSKAATPLLDTRAPGWRQPTGEEQRAAFGATRVGGK